MLSEKDKEFIGKMLNGALGNFTGVNTMRMSLLFNSIELFQLERDQYIQSAVLLLWNEYIKHWKAHCIPKIKANAAKWPEMKEEHLNATKEFFRWLDSLGLLSKHRDIFERTNNEVEKILSNQK